MSSNFTYLPAGDGPPVGRMVVSTTGADFPVIELGDYPEFVSVNLGRNDDPGGWLLELAQQATRLAAEYQHAVKVAACDAARAADFARYNTASAASKVAP